MEELIKKYVKENNIKSYLTAEDINKIYNLLNEKQINKIKEDFPEDYRIEDIINLYIDEYNYILAMENEDIKRIMDYIMGCEFDIEINENGKIDLIDLQGAYLGGNYDNFPDIISASERLEGSFYKDYYGIEVF